VRKWTVKQVSDLAVVGGETSGAAGELEEMSDGVIRDRLSSRKRELNGS
jgi:hypothetical protein